MHAHRTHVALCLSTLQSRRTPGRARTGLLATAALAALAFAGASHAAEPAEKPCEIQDENGETISCDAFLERAKARGTAVTREAQPAGKTGQPADEPCVLLDSDGQVVSCEAFLKRPPAPPAPVYTREPHPLDAELEKPFTIDVARFPLVRLVREVQKAEVEKAARVYQSHAYLAEQAFHEEVARKVAVLDDVMRVALKRVRICELRAGVKRPNGFWLTAGGPVYDPKAAVAAAAKRAEVPGCERARFVDQKLIDDVTQLHAMEHKVRTAPWGYAGHSERRALQEKAKALRAQIFPDESVLDPAAHPIQVVDSVTAPEVVALDPNAPELEVKPASKDAPFGGP